MSVDYDGFLRSKVHRVESCGFDPGPLDDSPLFPFQRALTRWALKRGRALIAADTGLGKTLMELEWSSQVVGRTFGQVLILAPLSVAKQTERMARQFGYEGVAYCRSEREAVESGASVVVTNYEMMDAFCPLTFVGIVSDESSILKHFESKTRTAIIDSFRDTDYKLSATATPAPNDYMELGNQSEFLGVMTRAEMLSMFFTHDGGDTSKWRLMGHGAKRFWPWLAQWCAYVKLPSDLGFDDTGYVLPELRMHHRIVECAETLPGELFPKVAATLAERRHAQTVSIDARVAACAETVNGDDETWIVWCHRNEESAKLARRIRGAVEIAGSMSPSEKERRMDSFLNGDRRVLVTKPSISGFGLNLQFCSRMAFVGLNDSYESVYQAIRREWRFGQVSPVDVHMFSSDAEGNVVRNLERKQAAADEMAAEMRGHMAGLTKASVVGSDGDAGAEVTGSRACERGDDWSVYLGDCVDVVADFTADSIDYTVFSPPFASLYTYSDSPKDMGNCVDREVFHEHFSFLVSELARVTKPGRLVSFHCMNLPTLKSVDGYIGIIDFRGDLIRAFQRVGFIYHSEVCIWKDPVTAMQRTHALRLLHKQLKKDSTMSGQGIPDYIVTMRNPGENPSPVTHTNESYPVSKWQKIASPIWTDINPSDTLQFRHVRESEDERHIAPLQLEAIRRCLELWSNPDDLVLSPFAGIGSEGYVSVQMGRRFVGVELKKAYWTTAVKNMREAHKVQTELFELKG